MESVKKNEVGTFIKANIAIGERISTGERVNREQVNNGQVNNGQVNSVQVNNVQVNNVQVNSAKVNNVQWKAIRQGNAQAAQPLPAKARGAEP